MCGINGVFHFKNTDTTSEALVVKMRDTLVHRGPDDAGVYVSPDKKVGLGTRRLKIIDLSSAGHMPMSNTSGDAWITFNGEIYNFQEIKKDLEKKGYQFRSRTDTEVIINAYSEYGFDCVKKLNGMFAFAIYDEKKKLIFAARDHIGIKPFYWALQNGTFYFGSEIKAILAHPDFKKELDEKSVSRYLTFSSLPAPYTLFRNVSKLAPARYLVIRQGKEPEEREYWNPVTDAQNQKSEEYFIEETRGLLRESVQSQMVSDVPFGCFLSGGIDSSLNAALMSEALGKPVETFSVGSAQFEKYNEFEHSRKIAKLLGARIHEILVTENHLEEFLSRYAYFADDPNADQVCLPLFWLAKLTRESGTIVIQVGEGSDEIFAGYPVYLDAVRLYNQWWVWLQKLPLPVKKILLAGGNLLTHPKFEFHKEYLRRLALNQEPFWGYAIAFSNYQKEKLLTPQFQANFQTDDYSVIESFYKEIRGGDKEADFLKQLTYLEIKNRLPEVLLARTDKMTMAHSVEARVPFLDRRLVELALQIPEKLKLKNNTTKYILKKAAAGIIPDEIVWRKKKGFATSISEWLKPESPVASRLINIIRQSKIRERKILNYDYVEELLVAHQKRGVEHNFRIWNLITLSLWYDYWFGK